MADIYPNILRLRAETIIKKQVKAAYKTDQVGIARCVLADDSIVYVDLDKRKVVEHVELQISYEQPILNSDNIIPISKEVAEIIQKDIDEPKVVEYDTKPKKAYRVKDDLKKDGDPFKIKKTRKK